MKKILICEDEKDALEALQNILTKKGYEVYGVDNGSDAIIKAKEINPDVILLDIRMPKIDGLAVAQEVRSSGSQAKIIFITAFASPEIKKEAQRYNISDYLIKPVSPEEIAQKL